VNRKQAGIRTWNFTQVGVNLQANGAINGPCTIGASCTQIPVTKGVCEDNSGTWWGPGHDDPATDGVPPEGFQYCCEVNAFLVANSGDPQGDPPYAITPLTSVGVRNTRYKIVQNSLKAYVSQEQQCVDTMTTEFYEIDEAVPAPTLDEAGTELPLGSLTPEQQRNYDALAARLAALLSSQPPCPGDGNIDFVVNQKDLDDWRFYNESSSLSSVYDLNLDGVTDDLDRAIIEQNLGTTCLQTGRDHHARP
jgi:hypothetical protein